MKFRHLAAACLVVALLVACKRPAPEQQTAAPAPAPENTSSSEPVAATPDATPAAKPDKPSLHVTTVDGKPYDLAAHRDQWVVVNFWATWCGPCLKEMPELSALDAMREHIDVIGLAYEDIDQADMQAFLKKHPVVYPIAIVDVMDPPADFATPRGLPMTYLIAPDGKVAKQFLGPVTARDIEGVIGAVGKPAADKPDAG